jgi:hypothetical protein
MNSLRKPVGNLLSILWVAILSFLCLNSSCQSNNKPDLSHRVINEHLLSYDSIRNSLRGASLIDTYTNIKTYHFTSDSLLDTFQLIIPSGEISTTKSLLRITSRGRIIYDEKFSSYYFVKDLLYDSTFVNSGNTKDTSVLRFVNSISKKHFEAHLLSTALHFFDNASENISFISRDSFLHATRTENYEYIDNWELLKEIQRDSTKKIFSKLCFDCDEGVSYMAYSDSAKMVLSISSED